MENIQVVAKTRKDGTGIRWDEYFYVPLGEKTCDGRNKKKMFKSFPQWKKFMTKIFKQVIDVVLNLIDDVIEEMKAKKTLNEFSEDAGFDKISHKIITEVAPRLISDNNYTSQEKALVAKIKRTYAPDNTRTMTRNDECIDVMEYPLKNQTSNEEKDIDDMKTSSKTHNIEINLAPTNTNDSLQFDLTELKTVDHQTDQTLNRDRQNFIKPSSQDPKESQRTLTLLADQQVKLMLTSFVL